MFQADGDEADGDEDDGLCLIGCGRGWVGGAGLCVHPRTKHNSSDILLLSLLNTICDRM